MAPDSGHFEPNPKWGPTFIRYWGIPSTVWKNTWKPEWRNMAMSVDIGQYMDFEDFEDEDVDDGYSYLQKPPHRRSSLHPRQHQQHVVEYHDDQYYDDADYSRYSSNVSNDSSVLVIVMISVCIIGLCCCMISGVAAFIGGYMLKGYTNKKNKVNEQQMV